MKTLKRLWQHLLHPRFRVQRYFPTPALESISRHIGASEQKHLGQIRFVIESNFPLAAIINAVTPRERAYQWFCNLGIWDTEQNCGVLVYIDFADHAVEIIVDRGIAQTIPNETWQQICDEMQQLFHNEQYLNGLTQGLNRIDAILQSEYPRTNEDFDNELPNDVVVL